MHQSDIRRLIAFLFKLIRYQTFYSLSLQTTKISDIYTNPFFRDQHIIKHQILIQTKFDLLYVSTTQQKLALFMKVC